MRDRQCSTVLVVDDAPDNIAVLNAILSPDYRVLFAVDGRTALQVAREQQPDLILLDIEMPDMSGHVLCVELKEDPSTRDIPVIFVTVRGEATDEEAGLALGAVDYITKPVQPAIVKLRVRNQLELKKNRDHLASLSALDGLTGIASRRRLDEFLTEEWARSQRFGFSLSLVLLDIDHFKAYNDHYGHLQGDRCLKTVAQCLAGPVVRATDLVARYGGEEFAVVLAATEHDGAIKVANKLVTRVAVLELEHACSKTAAFVTVSAGLATIVPDRDSIPAQLIEAADRCLYQAKSQGRNRVVGQLVRCS